MSVKGRKGIPRSEDHKRTRRGDIKRPEIEPKPRFPVQAGPLEGWLCVCERVC